MSLTISELESERARILEEIESKASKISQNNPSQENSLSLNDWLNAAEEVMPENPKLKQKSNYSNKLLSSPNSNNKASFFGVIIMLSLFLTILGVIYIAYTSIHKELQAAIIAKEENMAQIKLLQSDMENLSEVVASGGKSELFSQLENKVITLENKVAELNQMLSSQDKVSTAALSVTNAESQDSDSATVPSVVTAVSSSTERNTLVTESILDEKLKSYTDQLESKIDKKLEVILNHLRQGGDANLLPNLKSAEANSSQADSTVQASEIETPTVNTVETPVVEEPLVKLVAPVSKPLAPKAPDAPLISSSQEVNWLLEQPKMHYILQLASMPDADSLKKIAAKNQLKDAKILPQTRNNVTNYVLVTGSFANRDAADALAKEIKSSTGITPWVRKVRDLSSRVQ
ncbi:hypothetical protein THMIRHAM_11510 [Thiomicrorhabdus immobilis]|uniref:SPOR domain-containing protein n=1 Tax=Thiomicrorhabdus immobilis TaxID=2791037 RepID=A0ABN6CWG1_9GAMM|nr:SPOR domain-containing protein [Thiomicrorhabdus immobilis]BCN93366.1 hypothetical protein THMIRHAM_11510 [Thiomicrorhabdus immobilis]